MRFIFISCKNHRFRQTWGYLKQDSLWSRKPLTSCQKHEETINTVPWNHFCSNTAFQGIQEWFIDSHSRPKVRIQNFHLKKLLHQDQNEIPEEYSVSNWNQFSRAFCVKGLVTLQKTKQNQTKNQTETTTKNNFMEIHWPAWSNLLYWGREGLKSSVHLLCSYSEKPDSARGWGECWATRILCYDSN